MAKKYILELTEAQARAVSDATELYARLMTGQLEILGEGFPGSVLAHFEGEGTMQVAAEMFKRKITGFEPGRSHGIHSPVIPDKARVMFDVHQVVRHALHETYHPDDRMSVWADEPTKSSTGTDHLAKIEVKDN